jgi:hypothetical protein
VAAVFGCGTDSQIGPNWLATGGQEIHPGSDGASADAGVRCAAPLLLKQTARGARSRQRRSPASDVVKRRVFKQTELFADLKLLGAQFGEVALFAVDLIMLEVEVLH